MKKAVVIIKICRIVLLAVMLAGIGVLAWFPLGYRDIRMVVETSASDIEFELPRQEVDRDDPVSIVFVGMDQERIKNIGLYGSFSSIRLMEITAQQISSSLDRESSSEVTLGEKGRYITVCPDDMGRCLLVFNSELSAEIKAMARSRLMERMVLGLYWVTVCLVLYLITAAIKEKVVDSDNHGPVYEVKKFWRDMAKYWEYTTYAAKADLKAEVADSYLNRLWWLLEPMFSMLVYVIVFGRVMGKSTENYSTFIFSSILMWNFFSRAINHSVQLIRNHKDIVTKIYVPKFVLLVTNMISNFYKLLFSLVVLVPMMLIYRVPITINILWVIPTYVVLILFSFGVGMILAHFGVYVDDLTYAVTILLNMLMYLSGIFYDPLTALPSPLNQILICVNPLSTLISSMRVALLEGSIINVPIVFIWGVISLIICYEGVHIVYKNENAYVKLV